MSCIPRARGLALGYTQSPASTRARVVDEPHPQGSRTRPGLHTLTREYAGCPLHDRRLSHFSLLAEQQTRLYHAPVFTFGTRRSSCFLERRCLRPIMRFAPTIWRAKASSE